MVVAVEDILNQALRRIGNETPIGTIWEGSKASRAGLEIYGQTRDNLLREKDWSFARRDIDAVANGLPAPRPWLYEYQWPADCLRLRYVALSPVGGYPNLDPRPVLFIDFNEQRFQPAVKAILTTVSPATLIYTGQITDPATWDANFTEALVEALARRLALPITGSADVLGAEARLSEGAKEEAAAVQVNRPPTQPMAAQQRQAGR